jgi:lipopolysaccharide transport system ATP-binding protein
MSCPIIEVQAISKRYRLGDLNAGSFREELHHLWERWRGKAPRKASVDRDFWALRDVSFEVQPGEVLGIIGRNGAGKSTLLKVLSRITEPTSGRAVLRGRVASLLEVGTGFHPELSGGENVYLNGAILGMRRAEIERKFDEIVAFAEVEKFIDTPVKRYSSGMYVRLAFAVAAHLEPEILLIDEVLAVGDVAFQKKCLGKMEGVSRSGRTVLFVSHNMSAVETLCPRSIFVDHGSCDGIGPSPEKIAQYLQKSGASKTATTLDDERIRSDGTAEFLNCRIRNQAGEEGAGPKTNEIFTLLIGVRVHLAIRFPVFQLMIRNHIGTLMTWVKTTEQGYELPPMEPGDYEVAILIGPISYVPGNYGISINFGNPSGHYYVIAEDAIHVEVASSPLYGTIQIDSRWGCVYTPIQYEITPVKTAALAGV